MEAWTFDSPDPETTRAYARRLGQAIGVEGLAIALVGPLGAGKTVFVKGLAEGLGVDPRSVSSPTFVIAQEYAVPKGPRSLHHVDLYRLDSPDELESIGFYDMLAPGGVIAVEWADRFESVLGPDHLWLELEGPSELGETAEFSGRGASRKIRVLARGEQAAHILRDWSERSESMSVQSEASTMSAKSVRDFRMVWALIFALGLLGLPLFGEDGDQGSIISHQGGRLTDLEGASPSAAPPPGDCSVWGALAQDSLGTLSLRCFDSGQERIESRDSRPGNSNSISGMGRLLTGGRVNVNVASRALLESLPGVGPVRAGALVEGRPFSSMRDLERVSGIGRKTRIHLAQWLKVLPKAELRDRSGEVAPGSHVQRMTNDG